MNIEINNGTEAFYLKMQIDIRKIIGRVDLRKRIKNSLLDLAHL